MKRIAVIVVLGMLIASSSCGRKSDAAGGKHILTIAGSTSVMPFTEKLAEYFMLGNHTYIINVQGGGSTAGIQASLNGTVDIGMSSRELKDDERELKETVICYDGIALVVNPANPITGLNLSQIHDIYSGKIKNWKDLGWIDRRIDAVTREEGSGTRGAFEELVMKKADIDDGLMVQDSNGSVKEVVKTDPYSIGYISLGLIDSHVKAVQVDGAMPTESNIKKKRYKIVRPFLFLSKGDASGNARVFMDYVLSKDGQAILKKEGLITIHE